MCVSCVRVEGGGGGQRTEFVVGKPFFVWFCCFSFSLFVVVATIRFRPPN